MLGWEGSSVPELLWVLNGHGCISNDPVPRVALHDPDPSI